MTFNDLPQEVKAMENSVREAIPGLTGSVADLGTRLHDVARAAIVRVEHEAPGAPIEAKHEAAIRYGGALYAERPNVIAERRDDPSGTALELRFPAQATRNLWRSSGAASILGPYKVRRAGGDL